MLCAPGERMSVFSNLPHDLQVAEHIRARTVTTSFKQMLVAEDCGISGSKMYIIIVIFSVKWVPSTDIF